MKISNRTLRTRSTTKNHRKKQCNICNIQLFGALNSLECKAKYEYPFTPVPPPAALPIRKHCNTCTDFGNGCLEDVH